MKAMQWLVLWAKIPFVSITDTANHAAAVKTRCLCHHLTQQIVVKFNIFKCSNLTAFFCGHAFFRRQHWQMLSPFHLFNESNHDGTQSFYSMFSKYLHFSRQAEPAKDSVPTLGSIVKWQDYPGACCLVSYAGRWGFPFSSWNWRDWCLRVWEAAVVFFCVLSTGQLRSMVGLFSDQVAKLFSFCCCPSFSVTSKRKLQRKRKPNATKIFWPMTDEGVVYNFYTFDWLSQLGYVGFEFALQITFGA